MCQATAVIHHICSSYKCGYVLQVANSLQCVPAGLNGGAPVWGVRVLPVPPLLGAGRPCPVWQFFREVALVEHRYLRDVGALGGVLALGWQAPRLGRRACQAPVEGLVGAFSLAAGQARAGAVCVVGLRWRWSPTPACPFVVSFPWDASAVRLAWRRTLPLLGSACASPPSACVACVARVVCVVCGACRAGRGVLFGAPRRVTQGTGVC